MPETKDIILAALTAIIGAIGFFIRKIFTSEKKIEILEQSLIEMKGERKEHDDKVDEMLTELRLDIKNILQKLASK